jgi:glycerol-3-phosphate dehydrogenase
VLITPTVYGNVMLGPTSEDIADRGDTSTTAAGFDFLLSKGAAMMPDLLAEEVTAAYAGLRAASNGPDFLIDVDVAQRYAVAGGIRSTGLTAGMAIAEHIEGLLRDCGHLPGSPRDNLQPPRMPNIGEAFPRPYQDAARIAADHRMGAGRGTGRARRRDPAAQRPSRLRHP